MDKVVATAAEAIVDITDGSSLAVGGFGLCGAVPGCHAGDDGRRATGGGPAPIGYAPHRCHPMRPMISEPRCPAQVPCTP